MKIWAISSGEYSTYAVERCFTSRELAVEYLGDEQRNHYFIEEFELHDAVPPRQLLWTCVAFVSETRANMEPEHWLRCKIRPTDEALPELEESFEPLYGEQHFYARGTDREAVYQSVARRYSEALRVRV
jgi:hypothetical protein